MQLGVKLSLATTDQTRHALPPAAMGIVAATSLLDKGAPQPPTPGIYHTISDVALSPIKPVSCAIH
jgi:hypothetical protein